MNAEVRKYRFEAKVPKRRLGEWDRTATLEEKLNRPGMWASEIVRKGNLVSWLMTIPDDIPINFASPIQDTVDFVGAVCSDTVGPKSRKAILRFAIGDEKFNDSPAYTSEIVCPGEW